MKRALAVLVLMVLPVSACGSDKKSAAAWGSFVAKDQLGTSAPGVFIRAASEEAPLMVIASDWNGSKVTPESVDWDKAPTVEISGSKIRFVIKSKTAPMTARIKIFSVVDPASGIPQGVPDVDLECPTVSDECAVKRIGDGYEVTANIPETYRGSGYASASFRWGFTPEFENGQSLSRVDNVWSVAGAFRISA